MMKSRAHYFHMLRVLKHYTFAKSGNTCNLCREGFGGNLPYIWWNFRR